MTDLSHPPAFAATQPRQGADAHCGEPQAAIAGSTAEANARPVERLQIGLIALLLAAGTVPLAMKFLSGLGDRPQYEFYPLLIIASIALLLERWKEMTRGPMVPGNRLIGAGAIAASFVLTLAGSILYVRWLGWPALLTMLAGIVWSIGGLPLTRRVLPCLVLLMTILPPPGRFDQVGLTYLQTLAVKGSSRLLDLLDVPNIVSGTTIEIPGHRLLVEQACSGINSVVSISAFTLLYGFYHRRNAVRLTVLLAIAVFFILLVNLIRIVLGAVLLDRWNINLLEPSVHATVGFVLFTVGLGLTLSADQLLEVINDLWPSRTPPTQRAPEPASTDNVSSSKTDALSARRNPVFQGWLWFVVGGLSVALGGWSFVRLANCWPASRLSGTALFAPPVQVGSWRLIEGAGGATQRIESVARYQQRWVYQDGGDLAEVSLAYPFNALYHDASECYQYTGWQVAQRSSTIDQTGLTNVVQLTKAGEADGLLFFAAFDEAGRADLPAERSIDANALMRMLAFSKEAAMHHPTCEVQTLRVAATPLDDQNQVKLRQLFVAVRNELQAQVVRQANP